MLDTCFNYVSVKVLRNDRQPVAFENVSVELTPPLPSEVPVILRLSPHPNLPTLRHPLSWRVLHLGSQGIGHQPAVCN